MRIVTFTQFRKDASRLLTEVEGGASLVIVRHGKPVAEIVPYSGTEAKAPAWKKPGLRLEIQGASLADAIIAERDEER